jgi:uncharacterized protein YjbI with pentapeptide repeats
MSLDSCGHVAPDKLFALPKVEEASAMADEEHFAQLKQGVAAWPTCRDTIEIPDLRCAYLNNAHLNNADLREADLGKVRVG